MQDLVGVRAPDAEDRALVAQQRVQLPAAREHGLERGVVERRVERLGAEARELLVQLGGRAAGARAPTCASRAR